MTATMQIIFNKFAKALDGKNSFYPIKKNYISIACVTPFNLIYEYKIYIGLQT